MKQSSGEYHQGVHFELYTAIASLFAEISRYSDFFLALLLLQFGIKMKRNEMILSLLIL